MDTNALTAKLAALPGIRQIGLLFGLALAVAVGLFVFFWTQAPAMTPIFTGLDDKDAAEITEALRASNVPFKLEGNGAISVPEAQVRELRLKLAAQGLPAGTRSDVDTLMQSPGFGVSQFMENARYQHALESDLASTIGGLKPVRNARVHLAMSKPSAFARERGPASASVLVELLPGRLLDPDQVAAIVHLVASSIPELEPQRVTVVDQFGRLLTTNSTNNAMSATATQFDQVHRLEETYVARVRELLEPMTGPGRVSAQVALDMDFAEVEEARESFTPDAKVRSEQTSESTTTSGAAAPQQAGVPGATTNQPPNSGQVATAPVPPQSQSKSESRNFELDRTVSHTRNAAGRIKRLSIAVLVDNVPKPDAKGKVTLQPLSAEELTRVESLVKQAVGYDEKRGDSLSVLNAAFATAEPEADPESLPIWERPWVRDVLRYGVGAFALLMLILTVVRPAVKNLIGPRVEVVEEPANPALPRAQNAEIEDAVAIMERKLQLVRSAAQQDPRRVAQVVKTWVAGAGPAA